jgi:outer membrane murein-binding lipoprotein Lpp
MFLSENILLLVERLTANFTSSFNTCVENIVDAIGKKFEQRMDCHSKEVFELNKRIDSLERQNEKLQNEKFDALNRQLQDKINQLNSKVETLLTTTDDLEQYSRNTNLLLHGVQSSAPSGGLETNLLLHVVQTLNTNLGTSLQESDINAVHRIGCPTSSHAVTSGATSGVSGSSLLHGTSSTPNRPLPIIIQFVNKKIRNSTISLRKNLKGKGITLTEQLTSRRAALLKKCSDLASLKRVESAWSHDGRILIKILNHRNVTITTEGDLMHY